jgi:beta-glucosidase
MNKQFPPGFLWGAASAAYQVEGAAAEDGRGASIWDVFARLPGKVANGETGEIACDQYHRLEADLDLIASLNLKAYRFSVSWPRVVPAGRGAVNSAGLDYYERLVDGLLSLGIAAMVTLYHWDLPQALQEEGGWAQRDVAFHFADHAGVVHQALGDRVSHWVTVNEPWCVAFLGYRDGIHAPGLSDEKAALAAVHHQLLAHGLATQRLRADGLRGVIGPVLNLVSEVPASDAPADIAATKRLDGIENRLFLDPLFRGQYPRDIVDFYRPVSDFAFVRDGDLAVISEKIDYLGVNYYERHITRADPDDPQRDSLFTYPGQKRTAVGIGINPEGLLDVLLRVNAEYTRLPIYVTETGIAVDDIVDSTGAIRDRERIDFYVDHLRVVREAISQRVDIRGFFAWSLLDSFEWAMGYSPRYGLVYVDFKTQMRIPKESALWYRQIIEHNGGTL